MVGKIADIKRFAVHDGPGIRTTVFLKGCTLSCIWCHNPECIDPHPELAYYEQKCINCGECVKVCPSCANWIKQGIHVYDRSRCVATGACAEVCLGKALVFYGREMSVEEVMSIVLEDRLFYENSEGGMTLSGGEPLSQALFCKALLMRAKEEKLHTAVDTCGAVPWERIESVLPVTDLFLYDVKHMDSQKHKQYTGAGNELILDNLKHLSNKGAIIEIRIPLIPGINDDDANIDATGAFLGQLKGIQKVRVLPYHSYARSKYVALGKKDKMPHVDAPTDDKLDLVVDRLNRYAIRAVSGRK